MLETHRFEETYTFKFEETYTFKTDGVMPFDGSAIVRIANDCHHLWLACGFTYWDQGTEEYSVNTT